MQQERLEATLRYLIELCIRDKLRLEFSPPTEDPQSEFGEFCAATRAINIFKERTAPMNIFHVYSLAHEYRHYKQWESLDGYESWLYSIGYTAKDDQAEAARLEIDADEYAFSVLRQHKVRITKKLKEFVADRKAFFEGG